ARSGGYGAGGSIDNRSFGRKVSCKELLFAIGDAIETVARAKRFEIVVLANKLLDCSDRISRSNFVLAVLNVAWPVGEFFRRNRFGGQRFERHCHGSGAQFDERTLFHAGNVLPCTDRVQDFLQLVFLLIELKANAGRKNHVEFTASPEFHFEWADF